MSSPDGSGTFRTLFLRDVEHGGSPDQLRTVADALAAFADAATATLDLAIYDFRIADEEAAATVIGALADAAARGVTVRIGYDAGKPAAGLAEPAPDLATLAFAEVGGDPAPVGTQVWVTDQFAGTEVQLRAIHSAPQLMHSKYLVRDAGAESVRVDATPMDVVPAVWTGSTNFTDAAWTRQENNILTVADPVLAAGYAADFDELWSTGEIRGTGAGDGGSTDVDGAAVGWDFGPGDGPSLDAGLSGRIRAARSRLVVGAMVLTSHGVLAALADAVDRGIPLSGIYDGGQMEPIVRQWEQAGNGTVLDQWTTVAAHLVGKDSAPYTPGGPHDFMHLKVLLSDDTVTTGSYNFSANAERNAENQVHVGDPATVAAYADYLQTLIDTYA